MNTDLACWRIGDAPDHSYVIRIHGIECLMQPDEVYELIGLVTKVHAGAAECLGADYAEIVAEREAQRANQGIDLLAQLGLRKPQQPMRRI